MGFTGKYATQHGGAQDGALMRMRPFAEVLPPAIGLCRGLDDTIPPDEERPHVAREKEEVGHAPEDAER